MFKKLLAGLLLLVGLTAPALAANCSAFTYTLTNGTVADASQVMSNFNNLLTCANSNLAHNAANSDITSLSGLTTPLTTAQGGTGLGSTGAAGQILTSNGTNWQSATIGNGISSTAGGVVSINASFIQNFIGGLTLSNDGVSPNTVIDVAAGVATDSTSAVLMKLAAFTKNMNAVWALGTGNGCADGAASYTTLAASTWYHVYEISRNDTGVVDVLCSKSATAPALPTNYNNFRRLGSVLTNGSSNLITFQQDYNKFRWKANSIQDVATTNPGTSAVTVTLTTPLGVVVQAEVSVALRDSTSGLNYLLLTSLDETDRAASSTDYTILEGVANAFVSSVAYVKTNTSSQIRYRINNSGASDTVNINTFGWYDTSLLQGK